MHEATEPGGKGGKRLVAPRLRCGADAGLEAGGRFGGYDHRVISPPTATG